LSITGGMPGIRCRNGGAALRGVAGLDVMAPVVAGAVAVVDPADAELVVPQAVSRKVTDRSAAAAATTGRRAASGPRWATSLLPATTRASMRAPSCQKPDYRAKPPKWEKSGAEVGVLPRPERRTPTSARENSHLGG
jgi:hypothetical protein